MTRQIFATSLQVLGFAALTTGTFLWSVPAGLIVAGVTITIIGFALGQDR